MISVELQHLFIVGKDQCSLACESFDNIIGLKEFESEKVKIEGRVIHAGNDRFFLISFLKEEIETTPRPIPEMGMDIDMEISARVSELEKELQFTKESLQATVEELETSNEELQSSNEELIASNEELQSVNEELYTVNSEHQSKIEQLVRLNTDLDNLLKNTQVGALYLDRSLCIRKITPVVTRITNILSTDIGRPISHISVMNDYPGLIDDIHNVVETLQSRDLEIVDKEGNVWLTRIRPYRTEYNAVEGIMLTFIDITNIKDQEKKFFRTSQRLKDALDMGQMAWWEWNIKTGKVSYDPKKATMLGYTEEEFPKEIYAVCDFIHPDDYEKTMEIMREHLEGKRDIWEAIYRIRRKDGEYSWYYDRGRIVDRDEKGAPLRLIGTVIDVTRIKELEEALAISEKMVASLQKDTQQ